MTLFNDIQKQVIRDYIFRNDELFESIWKPEYHRLEFERLYGEEELTDDERRGLQEKLIANDEVVTRVYVLKKWKGELLDMFEDGPRVVNSHSINKTEINLLIDYIGRRDESNENQSLVNAILTIQELAQNDEMYKLFENDGYDEFLMPNQQ